MKPEVAILNFKIVCEVDFRQLVIIGIWSFSVTGRRHLAFLNSVWTGFRSLGIISVLDCRFLTVFQQTKVTSSNFKIVFGDDFWPTCIISITEMPVLGDFFCHFLTPEIAVLDFETASGFDSRSLGTIYNTDIGWCLAIEGCFPKVESRHV